MNRAAAMPSRAPGSSGEAIEARAALVRRTDRMVLATVLLASVLLHPLGGVSGDGRIYMGRALADLDPAGVGRDLMFTLDGQSAFSVFRILASFLQGALSGAERAAAVISILDLAIWSVAVAVLVRAIVPGRAWIVALAAALVLPRIYAPWHLIGAGESLAEPRPLAEAGVLLAMAALYRGRPWLCLCALAIAALVHPIMALPGFGVLLVVLGRKDRRWFFAAALCGAAVVVAGLLGAPLASRLMATFDPAWRAILVARNPYLFLGLWPIDSLTPLVVRAATIALALAWLDAPARRIVMAACCVAALGIVATLVLGDRLFDVLVVQLQLWRALWLPTVLSTIAAGICLAHLPSRGAEGRVALALLAVAWITIDDTTIAPIAAVAAICAFLVMPRLSRPLAPSLVLGVWICCAIVAGAVLWQEATAARLLIKMVPAGVPVTWQTLCSMNLPAWPILALTFAWWRWPDRAATRIGSFAALGVGLVLLLSIWDSRPRPLGASTTMKPDLVAMLDSRKGEVLWTEGDQAWYWLGRANWNAQIQGSSIVFSREQALLWTRRAQAVVEAGLATDYLLAPWRSPMPLAAPHLDPVRIKTFCAGDDRPVWIVAPLDADTVIADTLGARVWSLPYARGKLLASGDALRWQPLDRYALIPCAHPASAAASP